LAMLGASFAGDLAMRKPMPAEDTEIAANTMNAAANSA
jgi:hypothetical protein